MPDWNKIKAEYIRGGTSYRKLAEKYGVSLSSITRRTKKENWADLREQTNNKTLTKIVDSVASQEAKRADTFDIVTDLLMQTIKDGIENGTLVRGSQSIKNLSSAIKDLKEVKGLKTDLDMQEQMARIEKLRKEAQEESTEDKAIRVVIEGDLNDYA